MLYGEELSVEGTVNLQRFGTKHLPGNFVEVTVKCPWLEDCTNRHLDIPYGDRWTRLH